MATEEEREKLLDQYYYELLTQYGAPNLTKGEKEAVFMEAEKCIAHKYDRKGSN